MQIDMQKTILALQERATNIERWYKLSPYQLSLCEKNIKILLTDATELLTLIKALDLRDPEIRKFYNDLLGLISSIEKTNDDIKNIQQT